MYTGNNGHVVYLNFTQCSDVMIIVSHSFEEDFSLTVAGN